MPLTCVLAVDSSGVVVIIVGPTDVQRFLGGGWRDMAPKDMVLFARSLGATGGSFVTHWRGWRSERILRSIGRPIGGEGANGRVCRLAPPFGGGVADRLSGVFDRIMLRRLLPIRVKESSLTSRSTCWRSDSIDAARDAERGRDAVNNPFRVDTAPDGAIFAAVLWERTEWEDTDEA